VWRADAERLIEQEGFDMFHAGHTWDDWKADANR
jgi:hypothetical protein